MKKITTKIITLTLCGSLFLGLVPASGCSWKKDTLKGTALAEALLAQERINHEHLSQSFDFLDDRLSESKTEEVAQETRTKAVRAVSNENGNENASVAKNSATITTATASAMPKANARVGEGNSKGEIISGSGETAVYSWSNFEQLVTELHYFQSHFSAGQERTDDVEENISFLERHTDIKNKWVKGISYIDYLMQVEEGRDLIYADDTANGTYSVGIRKVNDEVNTTYEYYVKQKDSYIRTLATPNRRYEYSTVADKEVMAFVADNDNGYWRFTQLYSHTGESLSLGALVMTDDLAYYFRYNVSDSSIYSSDVILISPDLQYEIAKINGSEITVFPGSFTGINELRVSQEEQTSLGEYGNVIGFSPSYGNYSTYAIPHIYTDEGILTAPIPCPAVGGGSTTVPTPLDENVNYVNGNVGSLWGFVYPKLVFDVKGETICEQFDNLHTALAKYGIQPIYDKTAVGEMATDMLKLVEGYNAHYTWNGELLSSYENAKSAYEIEKAKSNGFEALFTEAKKLPSITERELAEIQQNAKFPALSFGAEASVSVEEGRITLSGLSASVANNSVLEKNKEYVLKLALKKNTDALEELVVLGNLEQDEATAYNGGALVLSLSGKFDLPTDVAEGEYDLVAYVSTADVGIRVSKFKRVLCIGEVNDEVDLEGIRLHTTITPEKVLQAKYERIFDVSVKLTYQEAGYTCAEVITVMENEIMDKGYFQTGAKLEVYDPETGTATPVENGILSAGIYRLEYLGQADGGKVVGYIYCKIIDALKV